MKLPPLKDVLKAAQKKKKAEPPRDPLDLDALLDKAGEFLEKSNIGDWLLAAGAGFNELKELRRRKKGAARTQDVDAEVKPPKEPEERDI